MEEFHIKIDEKESIHQFSQKRYRSATSTKSADFCSGLPAPGITPPERLLSLPKDLSAVIQHVPVSISSFSDKEWGHTSIHPAAPVRSQMPVETQSVQQPQQQISGHQLIAFDEAQLVYLDGLSAPTLQPVQLHPPSPHQANQCSPQRWPRSRSRSRSSWQSHLYSHRSQCPWSPWCRCSKSSRHRHSTSSRHDGCRGSISCHLQSHWRQSVSQHCSFSRHLSILRGHCSPSERRSLPWSQHRLAFWRPSMAP